MSSGDAKRELEDAARAAAGTSSLFDVFKHTKPRFASSRARQRYEMDTLRQQVRDLSAVLERARPQGVARALAAREHEELLDAAAVWKQAVLREHGQLKHALRVNEQLRRRLLDCGKLAKTIKAMVARNAATQTRLRAIVGTEAPSEQAELTPDDHAVFREVHADLDEMRRQAAPVIDMLLHHHVTSSALECKWRVRFDSPGPAAVEVLACNEVPFRKSEVERAMQALLLKKKPNQRVLPTHHPGTSPDTVTQLLRLAHWKPDDGISQCIHFTRTTATGDATTTTMESALVTFKGPDGEISEADPMVKYQSWAVLTSIVHVDPLTQQEQHSTLIRMLSRITPLMLDASVALLWEKEIVASTVIPTWNHEISTSTQQLENLLLDHQANLNLRGLEMATATAAQAGCLSIWWPMAATIVAAPQDPPRSLLHAAITVDNEWRTPSDADLSSQDSEHALDSDESSSELILGSIGANYLNNTALQIASPVTVAAPPASLSPPKMSLPRPKVASTHARHKSEIAALRSEAESLEVTLKQMTGAAKEKLMLSVFLLRNAEGKVSNDARIRSWKQTAKHHHKLLTQARSLNKRLRTDAAEHDRLIKRMRELVQQRSTTHAIMSEKLGLSAPTLWSIDGTLTAEDQSYFTRVLTNLDAMRATAQSKIQLLERERLPLQGSSRRWNVCLDPYESTGVEVVSCEEVPFRKSEVEHAMRIISEKRKAGQHIYSAERFGGAPDVLVRKSESRIMTPSGAGLKCAYFGSRMLVGSDRTLVVTVSFFSMTEESSCCKMSPAAVLKYETWTLILPTSEVDSVTNLEHHMTATRSFSSITPVEIREPRALLWQKQFFEKAVMPMWSQALTVNHQLLENVLLEHQATV